MQNDPHKCKIKPEKFHFDILYCYGIIKENLSRRALPDEIGLKPTKSDKTNNLDAFGSFILSVKRKSSKLGILQAFLQTYSFKEQIKKTNTLVRFSIKLRIYIWWFYIIFHTFAMT